MPKFSAKLPTRPGSKRLFRYVYDTGPKGRLVNYDLSGGTITGRHRSLELGHHSSLVHSYRPNPTYGGAFTRARSYQVTASSRRRFSALQHRILNNSKTYPKFVQREAHAGDKFYSYDAGGRRFGKGGYF